MIQSVLACLPVYFMSLFQISVFIKAKLDRIQKRFFWGGIGTTKKIHWVDWNSMCNLKVNGGLGIMDIGIKNRVLLNKWVWRYSDEPSAMWRKIIASNIEGSFRPYPLLQSSKEIL